MSVKVGESFPAMQVSSPEGTLDLRLLWESGLLVIAFHRMWCPFCQQAALELTGAAADLERVGAVTVIVYRETLDDVTDVCAERRTEAVCVSDEHRILEDAVGVERFNPFRYASFSPRRLLAAYRAGARVGRMGTHVLQGRGTYVVNGRGRVVYAHQPTNVADIPPIADVLTAATAAANDA